MSDLDTKLLHAASDIGDQISSHLSSAVHALESAQAAALSQQQSYQTEADGIRRSAVAYQHLQQAQNTQTAGLTPAAIAAAQQNQAQELATYRSRAAGMESLASQQNQQASSLASLIPRLSDLQAISGQLAAGIREHANTALPLDTNVGTVGQRVAAADDPGGLLLDLQGVVDFTGTVTGVFGTAVEGIWSHLLPGVASDVARYVAGGGKGLSLSLIAALEKVGAQGAAEMEKNVNALIMAAGSDSLVSRLPAVAGVLERVGMGLGVVDGVSHFVSDLVNGKGILKATADGTINGGTDIFVLRAPSSFGGFMSIAKLPEAWMIANGLGYIVDNIGSPAVGSGFSQIFFHNPIDSAGMVWHGITDGQVGAGVLNALSGGMVPADPNQIRADIHLAFNPQPPDDFSSIQKIAAQADVQYHRSGWDSAPFGIGLAFGDSSSDARRALYQQVLSNDMVTLVQNHDYAGINRLIDYVKQQPYTSDDVVRPYQSISWSLWHDPQANTSSTQAAQQFIVQALGQNGMQQVMQGVVGH